MLCSSAKNRTFSFYIGNAVSPQSNIWISEKTSNKGLGLWLDISALETQRSFVIDNIAISADQSFSPKRRVSSQHFIKHNAN